MKFKFTSLAFFLLSAVFVNIPATLEAAPTSGNITVAGATCSSTVSNTVCVIEPLSRGVNSITITIAGTFTGTWQTEFLPPGVLDIDANWSALSVTNLVTLSSVTSGTAAATLAATNPSYQKVRIRASALSAGTMSVTVIDGSNTSLVGVSFGGGGSTIGTVNQGTPNAGGANAWPVTFAGTLTPADNLSNPTNINQAGSYSLGWDATNSVWRRLQVDAATGTLKVDAGNGSLTLSDTLANPTTAGISGSFLVGWDATNTVWRRINVNPGSGLLDIHCDSSCTGSGSNAAASTIGSAAGTSADQQGVNVNANTRYQTGLTPGTAQTGTIYAGNTDLTSVGGTAVVLNGDGGVPTHITNGSATATNTASGTTSEAVITRDADQTVSATLQSAATANGNGTAKTITGEASALVTVNCTASCSATTASTITFQGQEDGSDFSSIQCQQMGSNLLMNSFVPISTTPTLFWCPVNNTQGFRTPITNYNTGTITVTAHFSPATFAPTASAASVVALGNNQSDPYTSRVGSHISSATTTTLVSGVANQKVAIYSGSLCVDAGGVQTNITIQDSANTNLFGTSIVYQVAAGQCLNFNRAYQTWYGNLTGSGNGLQVITGQAGPVEVYLEVRQQ